MAALISKPGLTSASTLSIPQEWDPTWFRKLIQNQLKGGDVRNAVGSGGIVVSGNLASPYATIGFGAPVTLPGPVTVAGGSGTSTALTVNAASGAAVAGVQINVTNAATNALILNGVTGTIGPDIEFSISSAGKAAIGVASKANEGITGSVAGDLFILDSTNRVLFSATSLASIGPVSGALVDMTPDTGSFTMSHTGFTTGVTSTVTWARIGKLVMLNTGTVTGTSNATTWTGTGLPADIQAARAQTIIIGDIIDSGAGTAAVAAVTNSGTVTFGKGFTAGGAFTNSGAKGTNNTGGTTFCYLLN